MQFLIHPFSCYIIFYPIYNSDFALIVTSKQTYRTTVQQTFCCADSPGLEVQGEHTDLNLVVFGVISIIETDSGSCYDVNLKTRLA